MAVASIVLKKEESDLDDILARPIPGNIPEVEEWTPSPMDRCDYQDCPSQAYVRATGLAGVLFFCSHHYNKVESTDSGKRKLKAFAFNIQDRRDMLIENRLVGEN